MVRGCMADVRSQELVSKPASSGKRMRGRNPCIRKAKVREPDGSQRKQTGGATVSGRSSGALLSTLRRQCKDGRVTGILVLSHTRQLGGVDHAFLAA